jgi:hypothetical protein
MSLSHGRDQAGHIDDVPARLTQPGQSGFARGEDAHHVQFKQAAEIINRNIISDLVRRMPARIINQTIEPSMDLERLIDHFVKGRKVSNIAWNETHLAGLFLKIAYERLSLLFTASTKHNLRARAGKRSHASFPNSFASPGDNYDFIFVSHDWLCRRSSASLNLLSVIDRRSN